MAEAPEHPPASSDPQSPSDMELVPENPETDANGAGKRAREGDEDEGETEEKKAKVERSVEEERLEKVKEEGKGEGEDSVPVGLGPKTFNSSTEMFHYFHHLLHHWSLNVDVNKYEHLVILDLLKKGHQEPNRKIGDGIQAFQVRNHPAWSSRCFFLVRVDGSSDDFSFRKCVDKILPLPDDFKPSGKSKGPNDNRNGGHHNGGGRGGRGFGGRGGRGGRGRKARA